jgi:small conductance mechanosensitive channel
MTSTEPASTDRTLLGEETAMKKSGVKNLTLFAILLVVFFWCVNPSLIPFVGDETRAILRASLGEAFGSGEVGTFGLSLPRLLTLLAVLALTASSYMAARFILGKIKWKGNRSRTIAGLALNVCKYAAVLVSIFWGLSVLGVNTTVMFASVGIIGLIVGFGAQSLIEDIITGVFIIFESQFNVGDIIVLDDFRGTVLRIGVRTTVIQDSGGSVKIINNSDIRTLQNRSLDLSLAICDIGIAYDQDILAVETLLSESLPRLRDAFPGLMVEAPACIGVQRFEGPAVILRIVAKVKEVDVYDVQRILNRELKLLFDANGVKSPFLKPAIGSPQAVK